MHKFMMANPGCFTVCVILVSTTVCRTIVAVARAFSPYTDVEDEEETDDEEKGTGGIAKDCEEDGLDNPHGDN